MTFSMAYNIINSNDNMY